MHEDIVSFGMDRSFEQRIVLFEKSHYLHMTFAIIIYLILRRKKILFYFFLAVWYQRGNTDFLTVYN